jgi:hypothetical protein
VSQANQNDYRGPQGIFSGASRFNAISFVVNQLLGERSTATLVQIKAVTNAGDLSPVGFVDVLPLVNQLDGDGNAVPHGVVHGLPYFRMQGGTNAIILDPQVGDIGMAVFADRDISSVKANKGQANPGSMRRSDKADGMYIGGFLNGTPTQYVQFSEAGIRIHSPTQVKLDAPDVQISAQTVEIAATTSATVTTPIFTVNGDTALNGNISQTAGSSAGTTQLLGPVTVTNDLTAAGKSVSTHTHHENGAGGNTNPPN